MNAFVHAFPENRKGVLSLKFQRFPDDRIELTVKDDGVGFPPGVDFRTSESLGLQIVSLLTAQINGTTEMRPDSGTEFRIVFQELKPKTLLS